MSSKKPSLVRMNTADGREDLLAVRMVSDAEERGYTDWVNQALSSDQMCDSYLPIIPPELYDKCADGLLLCKMINYSVPDTIDLRAINTGEKLNSVFCKNENLSLAVQSASAIGCHTVSIGPIDLRNGVKHIVLGLLWQIIRIGLIGKINLTSHAELIMLLRPGETLDNLKQLSPEEILIRWINYHLERANIDRRIKNFTSDIMDSEIYAHLLNQIAPLEYRSKMLNPSQALSSTDHLARANNVLANAEVLKAKAFIDAKDIAFVMEKGKNREKLNLAFVANLFNNYPGLHLPQNMELGTEITEETLEEKTYRNWMNSMGVDPYVKDIYVDLRNGLVLLYLIDVIQPNTVNQSVITRDFNPIKKLFQMQDNCVAFINYAKQLDINVKSLSAENIRESEKVFILGLCFQLLRKYTFQLLMKLQSNDSKKHIEDKDIIQWANKRCVDAGKSNSAITSFRDHKIKNSTPILDLIEAIKPRSVDFSILTTNQLDNAKYAISTARKIGANIYALPQHVVDLNQKMILTIYACLMLVDLKASL